MAEEIKIEETEFSSLQHPLQEQAEMDVIFAYKNLLALEDHLREFQPENDEEERQRIVQVLRETNGIVAGPRGAATRLGMKRTTLLSRMQRLGISVREVL